MKLVLIAIIFTASCKAGPLSQIKESNEPWAKFTTSHVDIAPAEFQPLNATSTTLVSRDTVPDTSCPAGQTYDRSVCYKTNIIRSFCIANPRNNREKITDRPCAANEVCVQRILSTGKSYAKCISLVNLISWKTSPDGSKEGCTSNTVEDGTNHHFGSIVYDVNKNPIKVLQIKYLGEPGDVNEGIGQQTPFFSSNLFSFASDRFLKSKDI